MTTFTPPLLMGDRSNNATIGDVSALQQGQIFFSSTDPFLMATLPVNSRLIEIYVDIEQRFNADISNTLTITTANPPETVGLAAVDSPVGRTGVSLEPNNFGPYTVEQDIIAQYSFLGTTPTEGIARVTVIYITPRPLPA